MSAEQHNTTERSSQDKSEWERSLVGHHQQHAYFPQQSLQQAQHAYPYHHHHHLAGGSLEGTTCQHTDGADFVFGKLNPTIDGYNMQGTHRHVNSGQGAVPMHRDPPFSILPLHPSSSNNNSSSNTNNHNHNNHRSSVTTAARPRQQRAGEEHMYSGKDGAALSISRTTKSSAPRRMRNPSLSPLTVRPTGTKDRHSKVRTAKGLRDRRVRLSAPTAIQFFDVQDRLGYDQPSKAVDWLIKKARAAIDELAPVEGVIIGDEIADKPIHEIRKLSKEHDLHSPFVKVKDEEQSMQAAAGGGVRAESRAKARERARERAKEKTATPVETTSTSPAPSTPAQPFTPPNLHLLPEIFLFSSQFRDQFDELHRLSDMSSMLAPLQAPRPAPHLIPFASPFFPANSTTSSFIVPGDGPLVQYSGPTAYNTISNNNNNNTPNSPRGTLQSIFSSPATSSMQAHVPMPPLMMMGGLVQAYGYGATTPASSIVRDGGHNDDAAFCQSSAELGSPESQQHSCIPMRIRGMELGSHVEEARITHSSTQADYQ